MRKAAARLGVAAPQTRGAKADAELLGALRLEIGKRLAKITEDDHVKCVVCDEVATEDTEFCPYCGDEGSNSETEALQIASSKTSEDDDADDEVEASSDEDDEDANDESDEDESDEEDDDEGDEDENEGDEGDEAAGEGEEESVGIAEGAVVAKDVGAGLKNLKSALDASLARISELKRNCVGMSYDIGLECRGIRDQQLFKARGYSSFKAFAEKELPFTRESALQLITIVEKHSRDDYAKIGYAKLRMISAVSDSAAKTELIAAARGGASTREIKDAAAAAGGKKKSSAAATAPAAEKGERITLLGKIGGKKVVRFQNTETGEVIKLVGKFQTKDFTPAAHAELEISDGVFLRVGLRLGANNELEGLTVRFVRAE